MLAKIRILLKKMLGSELLIAACAGGLVFGGVAYLVAAAGPEESRLQKTVMFSVKETGPEPTPGWTATEPRS